MNLIEWSQKNKDLLLRALATAGMILDLFIPFFGIALGVISLSMTHKDAKTDWRNADFYYALATVIAGVFILFVVIRMNLQNASSSSSSSI